VSESLRLFIAVDISEEARAELARLIRELEERGLRSVRWVNPAGVHVTLKFLGDTAASLVPRVTQAMERAAVSSTSMHLALVGTGVFPNERAPRVLWAGLQGDVDALVRLQQAVEREVSPLGFPAEGRGFSPHVTIGRVREGVHPSERQRIAEALARSTLRGGQAWPVEYVKLVRSTLTPSGAVYTVVARATLP
jgi:2'-5' RNA ligase